MEKPTENQRHSNLLHALHPYLRDAVVRSNRQGKTRAEFEKTAKTAEQIEPEPADFRHKKYKGSGESSSKTNSYRFHFYKPQRVSASQHSDGQAQNATHKYGGSSSGKNKQSDKGKRFSADEARTVCWGCDNKGHFEKNCLHKGKAVQSSAKEQDSGKAPS